MNICRIDLIHRMRCQIVCSGRIGIWRWWWISYPWSIMINKSHSYISTCRYQIPTYIIATGLRKCNCSTRSTIAPNTSSIGLSLSIRKYHRSRNSSGTCGTEAYIRVIELCKVEGNSSTLTINRRE